VELKKNNHFESNHGIFVDYEQTVRKFDPSKSIDMKRKIFFAALVIVTSFTASFAQKSENLKKIAPFKILLENGKPYSASQLSTGATILIYFSPDCAHCQDFTGDMLQNFNAVGNKQVVMVTSQRMEMLRPFILKYKISDYPNIKIGTEGDTRVVQAYYGVQHYPFIALYNKNGNLVKTFEGEQPHAAIFAAMKTL
jgi:thiol-disulfide isomerase/thioredoxin